LTRDKFLQKLRDNKASLVAKHNCRTGPLQRLREGRQGGAEGDADSGVNGVRRYARAVRGRSDHSGIAAHCGAQRAGADQRAQHRDLLRQPRIRGRREAGHEAGFKAGVEKALSALRVELTRAGATATRSTASPPASAPCALSGR
jgi:hypothetical protein